MSAFEADRFNRSRTSPRQNQLFNCEVLRLALRLAQDFGCGLPLRSRPQNASTFEADRFNRSRTSPENSFQWPVPNNTYPLLAAREPVC